MTFAEYNAKNKNMANNGWKTFAQFEYEQKMLPYTNLINSTNELINSFNSQNKIDYSKFGDYSSNINDYSSIHAEANNLLKQLGGIKSLINDDEYKKIKDKLETIADDSNSRQQNLKLVNTFYSSFEDENQYKAWETDNRLYAEHGNLTAENVDYFMSTMEKRKANGELNGYEQEFYDWIMQYDLTRGYKDKEYYDQRIALLEDKKSKLEEQKGIVWDKPVAGQDEIDQQIREIEGRIGDMKNLRNQLDRENVYEDKGYSSHKGAVDFEDKAKAYETSFATPLPADGSKDRLRVKDVKDKVIFAYQNKEVFVEGFFDSNIGWRKYAVSQEEANKIQEEWYKYTFLTPDEFSTYCYLKKNDKEQGTNSADKFMSDMEMTLDMRKTNAANDKIREDMNADGFKGAFATGFYNVLSVPATVLGGLQALPSAAVSLAKGEDINIYSNSFQISNFAQSVRTTTGEMIDSKGWNLVYNAVMSTADSLLAAAVFRGAAPYILAASAATSRMKELTLQGASDGEIIIGSLASGLIEVVTEKISIDRLFGGDIKPTTFKQFIKEGLTQAAIEGSEEIASEVLNNISDEMLRGSMSDYNQAIRRYEAEGLSRSEATKKAANDVLVQIFEAALSGMISGGIGGSVAGGSQMHKFNVIGTNIIEGGNVDTVLMAAEYMGSLDPEIKGQVQALNKFKESAKSGKANAAYKRTLGKVAATVAENVTEVKQSVTEKAVSNELKSRGIDSKTIGKVSKIVSKFLSGQKLSSSEQGYLQHNSVAATVMHEIEAAQEQVKAGSLPQSPTATAPSSDGANAQGSAPQWAVDLVNKLTTIDSAMSVINLSASGKSTDNTHNSDVNRMIKILSIASGKTTAEQEAEAGDIPYSQYIREKEAAEKEAAEKQNTAENSGEVENTETKIMKSFGITKLNDTLHVKKQVLETLEHEGFWENEEEHSTTVVNGDSKMDIVINESGIEETFSYKHFTRLPKDIKIKKLITVRKLPQIIQNGTLVSDNVENYHDKKSSVKYAYIECAVEIDGEPSVITVAIRKSSQKNKFWVHQVDIKQDAGSNPAGTSESSKTGYPTSDTTVIISSDEFNVNKNIDTDTSADDFTGFNEPDVSEDGVSYESRLLHTMRGEKITTEGQAYIKKICKSLGIEVIFENVFTPSGKHADGYIDSDGVIHLDYHCGKPVEFVLKHELTHYGESSALYSNFCKAVISSEAFAQWINGKVEGDGNVTLKAAEYREQVSRLYEKNGVKLSPAKQQSEMIANFVGEVLFSADTNGLERLTTNMPTKEKRSVIDFIRDFIAHIKEKLTKVKGVSSEILSLERKFNKLLSTAEQNKTAEDGGVRYSFGVTQQDIDNYVDAAYTKENTEDYKKYAKVSEKLINEVATEIDITGYSHALRDNDIRHIRNSHGENTNEKYPVTKEDIKSIPEIVANYDKVFVKTNSSHGPGLLYVKVMSDNVVYYVEAVTTVYGNEPLLINKQMVKTGIEEIPNLAGYKEAITKKESETEFLTELKEFREAYAQSVYQSHSTDIIDDNSSSVNSNSMQEIGDYSIPTETAEETSSTEADITEIPDQMAVIADRHKRGELTDEEYRIEVEDLMARAVEKYGAIKTGEKAEDKTPVAKRVRKGSKTRQHARTILESGVLPEEAATELKADILKDALSHKSISNEKAQQQANAAIERGTAVREWNAAIDGDGPVGKREIAIGETLLKLAAESKDIVSVTRLYVELSEMGTRAAQTLQAFSMLKRMDGIGKLYYVKRCVDRLNKDLDKKHKGKKARKPIVINETLAYQLAESKTQQDFDVTYDAMIQSIAEQVPTTFLDKWNAWRYLAMLGNPRTHSRNFTGNVIALPMVRIKDIVAATLELKLSEEKRTKSFIVGKEYREFAKADYAEAEYMLTNGGKMNPSSEIDDKKAVFKTKWLEKLRKLNFDYLEKEDAIFLKAHYIHALGGFLQARNIDITRDVSASVMREAREYAVEEAKKATYRDASALAQAIQNFSKKNIATNIITEGLLPFKKTPINIVKRGIEYSPIGLFKTLVKGTIDLKRGDISASQYIDGIAGGLTGTGILLVGMLLSSLGWISGGFGSDEEDKLKTLSGEQEYSVQIFGQSYTIDWMAPVCIPFFIGVELQNALSEEGNGNVIQRITNVLGNSFEPIINLSMLSGIQDVLSSTTYADEDEVVYKVAQDIVLSYFSQSLPTVFGAFSRTIDGKRRTTYIDKTSWVPEIVQVAINKVESKIPLLSLLRSEYVDEFGRTEDSGNVFLRAIQNFVSPGYYSKIEDDPVIEELERLYKSTGESVLPSKPKKYIEVGGEKIYLTADEYEEYAKEVGQERYDYLEEFMRSNTYKTLTDAEKREVISDLYSYAQAKGKTHYSEYKLPNLYEKVYEAEKNGVSPVVYYSAQHLTKRDEYDTNGNGKISNKEKLAAIRKMNVSNDIKAALIALYS